MGDIAGQEREPARLQLMALTADPHRHCPLQQQEHLVIVVVDVDGGGVTAAGTGVDDGKLPAGDRGVEQDGELAAAGVGQPLAGLAAGGQASATLVLIADITAGAATETVWGWLEGSANTGQNIIINTHTDGPNAAEENGGLGLLALARHLAALPSRPQADQSGAPPTPCSAT